MANKDSVDYSKLAEIILKQSKEENSRATRSERLKSTIDNSALKRIEKVTEALKKQGKTEEEIYKVQSKIINAAQDRYEASAKDIVTRARERNDELKFQLKLHYNEAVFMDKRTKEYKRNRKEIEAIKKDIVANDKKIYDGELAARKRRGATLSEQLSYSEEYYRNKLNDVQDKLASGQLTADQVQQAKAEEKDYKIKLGESAALNGILGIVNKIHTKLTEGVDKAMSMQTEYLGKVNARLQGTSMTWNSISENVAQVIKTSPYLKQEALLKNVATLTDSGIAYNLEERALLSTISDKIVSTFDVLDQSLTRLIRLQQSDLTIAQMGIESQLLDFFNTNFQDSSYLNDVYDSVSQAIIDANSQMNYQDTVKFNYAVQKWLGSLYELGMSSTGINTIAQGLNYLATGDVSALNSNSQLTTLFGLSAQKAGISYSDMLTQGLNADNVDDLMKAMVTYLQQISDNTQSQVTKAQWSNLVNLSVSDLRAIQNLTSNDIETIYQSETDYLQAMTEISTQFDQLSSRVSIAEQVENWFANFQYTQGNETASDVGRYVAFKAGQWASDVGMDILKSTGFTKLGAIVTGVGGVLQFFGSLAGTIEALNNARLDLKNGFKLGSFDATMVTERGLEWVNSNGGITGVSYSAALGTDSQLTTQAETAGTAIESKEAAKVYDAQDLYNSLFISKNAVDVNLASMSPDLADYQKEMIENAIGKSYDTLSDTEKTQWQLAMQGAT